MQKIKDYVIDENMNIEVVIYAKGTYDIFESLSHEVFRGLVKDIPESLMDRNVIQTGQYLRTGLPLIDIYAPDLM
jgi:hypothetical protein